MYNLYICIMIINKKKTEIDDKTPYTMRFDFTTHQVNKTNNTCV